MKSFTLKSDNLNINFKNYYEYLSPNFVFIKYDNNLLLKNIDAEIFKEDTILKNNCSFSFSPISGMIKGENEFYDYNGVLNKYIVIENNYKEKYLKHKNINKSYKNYKREDILKILNEFPEEILMEVRMFIESHEHISKIMIKGFDECLYNYTNLYYLISDPIKVLDALDVLNNMLEINKSYLMVKSKDIMAINNMINYVGAYPNLDLIYLPDVYPLNDLAVIKKFIGSYVDDNTLLLSIEELFCLNNLIHRNKCQTEKVVSIVNLVTKEVSFCLTKLNVLVGNVIKRIPDNAVVYLNNPLNAHYIDLNNTILTYQVSSIIIDKKTNVETLDCFNCGKCLEVCPLNLKELTASAACIKCNLCSYVCPANKNLLKEE